MVKAMFKLLCNFDISHFNRLKYEVSRQAKLSNIFEPTESVNSKKTQIYSK